MWWRRSATCSTRLRLRRRSNNTSLGSGFGVQGSRHLPTTQSPQPRALFGRLLRVYGHSMAPTLKPGELIIINERAYDVHPPQRGDMVAARPAAFGGRAFVKRIAGLPHERVTLDGREWRLGADQFFLLGDQRDDGIDSRSFGPVTRTELIGPVRLRLWPWTVFY